jgi:hypothetical protein
MLAAVGPDMAAWLWNIADPAHPQHKMGQVQGCGGDVADPAKGVGGD